MDETRLNAVRRQMQQVNADAVLITQYENRRYVSGFTGSNGALLITPDDAYIVTDFRYFEQVAHEAPGFTLHKQIELMRDALAELLEQVQPERLAFEADGLTVAQYKNRREVAPESITWIATEGLVEQLRVRKDDEEVANLRRAQEITDRAFERFLQLVQPGRTERELAWELEVTLHELGGDKAFDIIVAVGENAVLPHYKPSPGERVVREGDMVLVDFGARVAGYHADMTRTLYVGEPDEKYRTVYETCREALELAEREIHAGMNVHAAHDVVHDFLEERGYGENFGHGLGHGVGLAIHEEPKMGPHAPKDGIVPAGSAVTLEPGIYVPGWGGVRIEDLVIVRTDGLEILTQSTKDIDAWRRANR